MLILGHTGITLGAAVLLNGALARSRILPMKGSKPNEPRQDSSGVAQAQELSSAKKVSWLASLANNIDIRLLLLGALLPDIVDKPIGQFLFRDTFGNGRIFSHTLLFLIVITLAGLYLSRRHHQTWLVVLSAGTFSHLILDQMWLTPQTLFWPWFGFTFVKLEDIAYWAQDILTALLTAPSVYIPELTGAVILIWFVLELALRKKVYVFLRNGQV